MQEKYRRIFFRGQCIDNDDPLRLGRIRAIPKTENNDNIEKANEYVEWDYNDPFLYLPLIPTFNYSPPKIDEYVHLIYSDLDKKQSNDRFYIGGVFSSPTKLKYETYDSAVSNLDFGSRNKKYQSLKDVEEIKGVYAHPNDVSLYGRGNADIVIQDDTVVIRAGKNKDYDRNSLPLINNRRAFLQLTKYNKSTQYGQGEKKYLLRFEKNKLKKLVEYDIISSDNNGQNVVGVIYIYNIQQTPGIESSEMNFSTEVQYKSLSTIINCGAVGSPITIQRFSEIINETLNNLIDKSSLTDLVNEDTTDIQIIGPNRFDSGLMFPLFYRFEKNTYNNLNQTSDKIRVNNLMSLIRTNPSQTNYGYGLVYSKKRETNVPIKPVTEELIPQQTKRIDKSVSIMGADELYFLSHESQKPNSTGKIDMENTLYRIDETKIADEIEPKTSSMVRGEELFDIIGLIVRYLATHTHAFPGLPPVPISHDGTNVADLLQELLISSEKVLNKKIRIN